MENNLPEYIVMTESKGKTYYNFKLNALELDVPVMVEKLYPNTFEKTGTFGPYFQTTVGIDGLAVGLNLNPEQNTKWLSLPTGMVSIRKYAVQIEVRGKSDNGKLTKVKRMSSAFEFAVNGAVSIAAPKVQIKTPTSIPQISTVLDQRQLSALKAMVQNGHTPDTQIMVDGQVTTYRTFVGVAVNNPSQYV